MNTTQTILKNIKNTGLTKWKIAKSVGVSWQTVHMWEKGAFVPNEEHKRKLEEIANDNSQTNRKRG